MNKVILIDSGVVLHKAIFAWGSEKKRLLERGIEKDPIPASYSYLNTCYAILKKISIDRKDIVIVAQDARSSWRKAFLKEYKGQRKALRDSHEHIDWNLQYHLINKLEQQLNDTTNWHFIKLKNQFNFADLCLTKEGQELEIEKNDLDFSWEYGIESDDIQAVACKFFKDKEVILVTIDEDLSQLYFYDNVKIFNPNLKSPTNKAQKGYYNIIDEPKKILNKKIRLGDTSDNILVDSKNDSERDVKIRRLIIDLLRLPDFVEQPIINALKKLDYTKEVNYANLPFQNSLGKEFDTIYESNNVRTWEESVKRHLIKEMKKMEKSSKKSIEELYEKSKKYKELKDKLDEIKENKKVKV